MKIVDYDYFFMDTWKNGWQPKSLFTFKGWDGRAYECVCGKSHEFHHSRVVREMSRMRCVVECPDGAGSVCVKLKGIFTTKVVCLFGALNEN